MTCDTTQLRGVLIRKFGLEAGTLAGDAPLFSSGLLDSFNLVDLIEHLEQTANIRITPGEISLENLDTLDRMAAFVTRKSAAAV
jgi:acyl carrier protein